jgi:hypothetical protein
VEPGGGGVEGRLMESRDGGDEVRFIEFLRERRAVAASDGDSFGEALTSYLETLLAMAPS